MRRIRSAVSVVLVISMLFSLAACSSKVKEYDKDSLTAVLKDELGISDDDINLARNEKGTNQYPAADIVTAAYKEARINCYFCDDEADAKKYFEDQYDQFCESFDKNDQFKGSSEFTSGGSYGYIVLNGDNTGTSIFGTLHMTGPVHAAFYYSGSMVMLIMPSGNETGTAVTEIIDALGYPDVK